jgi:hypothetical protein
MKKMIFSIFVIFNVTLFAFSGDCQYYGKQANYFTQKAREDIASLERYQTTAKWCQLADDLEQSLNYLGSVQQNCANGYEVDDEIRELTPILVKATQKCGH